MVVDASAAPRPTRADVPSTQYRHYDSRDQGARKAGRFELPNFPTGTSPVFLSVTATDALDPGYLELGPCSGVFDTGTKTSLLSFVPGTSSTASTYFTSFTGVLGAPGPDVCGYVSAPSHVIVDVLAMPAASDVSGGMYRLVDTRSGLGGDRLMPSRRLEVPVLARGYNWATITVLNADGSGNLFVGICTDITLPVLDPDQLGFTNIAVQPGTISSTVVLAGSQRPLSDDPICLSSSVAVDVIVDVRGQLPVDAITPSRTLDTHSVTIASGGVARVQLMARVRDVAVFTTTGFGNGFLTAYPCDAPRPTVSQATLTPRRNTQTIATYANESGEVCLFASGGFTGTVAEIARFTPRVPIFDRVCSAFAEQRLVSTVVESAGDGYEVWVQPVGGSGMTLRTPSGQTTAVEASFQSTFRAMYPISSDQVTEVGTYTVVIWRGTEVVACTGFSRP